MELQSLGHEDRTLITAILKRITTDTSPALQILADSAGNPVGLNPTAATFFSLDAPEAWEELVAEESLPTWTQQIADAQSRRAAFSGIFEFKRCDGVMRTGAVKAEPRYGPEGTFIGHQISCLDITDVERSSKPSHTSQVRNQESARHLHELLVSTATVVVSSTDIVAGIAENPTADPLLKLVAPSLTQAAADLQQLLSNLNLISRSSDSGALGDVRAASLSGSGGK